MKSNFDFAKTEELKLRLRAILRNIRYESALGFRSEDSAKARGYALCELGAMLIDTCNGVDYAPTPKKKSTTHKVRKALGYVYP